MSRATLTQLRQLGLDAYAIDKVADDDKQIALDAAAARIDSAVANQYDGDIIPPYPLDIIQCECVLASWTLLTAQGYNPPSPGTDTNIEKNLSKWEAYLVSVSKGEIIPKLVLSVDDGDPGATGPAVITATQRGYSVRGTNYCDPFSSD